MKKEVWVSVCGLHFTDEEQAPAELITSGEYYFRNGKHYVLYEEALEGVQDKIKSRVKITGDSVEITRSGGTSVHMAFRPGKKHLASYQTPYGPLLLGMQTRTVQIQEQEERIEVRMEYDLEVEGEHLSACTLTIQVVPKDGAEFPVDLQSRTAAL